MRVRCIASRVFWTSRLGDRVIVSVQNSVQFPKQASELQPDLMLLKPREDFYTAGHPLAHDVLLLIEVEDTTLRLDRRVKIPFYRAVRALARGETLTPPALPDVEVRVEDLIG
jgi:hypothetical protein